MSRSILVRGARQLLTLRGSSGPRRGEGLRDLGLVEDGSVLIVDGVIDSVGPTRRIENLGAAKTAEEINAAGHVVMPAFVDSDRYGLGPPGRALEYGFGKAAEKITSADIADAAAAHARNTSPTRLEGEARLLHERSLRHGTVVMEAKTGFGVAESAEMKFLRVIETMRDSAADIVPVYAATSAPADFGGNSGRIVEWLCNEMLPRLYQRRLAEMVEIACDPTVLSLEHTMDVLRCARRLGLATKAHTAARSATAGVRLAIEFGVRSVSGLNYSDAADASMLAASHTIATLLPGAVFHRFEDVYPPARLLIDSGAAVALASGFHPALPSTLSMQAVIGLACAHMEMTAEEAIAAATINGAHVLQRANSSGSLEFRKNADLIILDVPDYREIPYHFGMNQVQLTMRLGRVVYREGAAA